jgi:hypothetical protein
MVALEIQTSGKAAAAHDESAKKGQELLSLRTIFSVHNITQVAAERTGDEVEKSAGKYSLAVCYE